MHRTLAARLFRKSVTTTQPRPRCRLNVEALESRELMNVAPVFQPMADRFLSTGTPFYAQVFATDVDRDWITYSAANLPQGLTINPDTGTVSGTVPLNAYLPGHSFLVTFAAADGAGHVTHEQVTYSILGAPKVWVVNTTADTNDANPFDNDAKDVNGNVSLRAAIQQANIDRQTSILPTFITFDPTVFAGPTVIDLLWPMDTIISDLTILGTGKDKLFIEGGGNKPIFQIGNPLGPNDPDPTVATVISGLTLQGGSNTGLPPQGGAIENYWNTVLVNVRVRDSVANFGGGAFSMYSLTLIDSEFTNNHAVGGGNGFGGAIDASLGHVTITNSILQDNRADFRGGAISIRADAKVFIFNSNINNNRSNGNGAGIYNSGGWLQMTGGAFTLNETILPGASGGGLFSEGTSMLKNVTFESNKATLRGGAVCVENGTTVLTGCAFVGNNQAPNGPKVAVKGLLILQGGTGLTELEIFYY